MKTSYLLLFLLLNAFSLWGQFEITVEDFGFTDGPFLLEETPGGQVVLLNDGLGDFFYRNSIVTYTGSGDQIFEYHIASPNGSGTINDIMFLPDGSVVWLEARQWAGCFEDAQQLTIHNNNWEEQNPLNVEVPLGYIHYGKFGGTIGGDFILFESGGIYRLGSDGAKVWDEGYFGGFSEPLEIWDLVVINEDSLLAATQFGLWIMNGNNGDVVENSAFEEYDDIRQLEILSNENLLGLSPAQTLEEDSLALFSPSLEQLDKIGFSDGKVVALTVWSGKIAVLTQAQHVLVYDEDLNLEHEFQVQGDIQFAHIALVSDGVVLAGRVQFGLDEPRKGNRAALLKKFSFDGNSIDQVTDVGIINIDQDQEPFSNQSDYYKVFFEDLKFTIQNFGEDVLDNVKINLEFAQIDTVCSNGYQRFSKKFEGLSILPGETVELEWGQLTVTFDEDPTGLLSFCAWTSQPNLKADVNHENDLHCYDFVVNDEEIIADAFFNIHPNPTTDYLNFQLRGSNVGRTASFRIVDLQGRVLRTFESGTPGATHIVPVWDWGAGVYFLQYVDKGTVLVSERFVVAK